MVDGAAQADRPWLANPESVRQLLLLSASKRSRTIALTRHRWEPGTVRHPQTGELFDTESAWSYIHTLLEQGVDVEEITLKHPQGKKAYVFFGPGPGTNRIYIKLEFLGQNVCGRSFHISDEKRRDNERV